MKPTIDRPPGCLRDPVWSGGDWVKLNGVDRLGVWRAVVAVCTDVARERLRCRTPLTPAELVEEVWRTRRAAVLLVGSRLPPALRAAPISCVVPAMDLALRTLAAEGFAEKVDQWKGPPERRPLKKWAWKKVRRRGASRGAPRRPSPAASGPLPPG